MNIPNTPQLHIPSTPGLPSQTLFRSKISDIIIERICQAYTREDARKDDIYYWPEPLPTPDHRLSPDPLVLFQSDSSTEPSNRISLVPLAVQEIINRRSRDIPKLSMQIPLGLIDKPETQQRDTLLIDLHGNAGALSGGPLLLLGTQNSGKGTALQTMLLWLTTRYLPTQLRCVVIDPEHDLDLFRTIPHLFDDEGKNLWIDGATDEEIVELSNRCTAFIEQRRTQYTQLHWNDETLAQLWQQGIKLPVILCVISQYHRFVDRPRAQLALKKLFSTVADARTLGVYVVLTSAEVGFRHLPGEILNKFGTRISLYISEQQRSEFFGRILPMDPIPGRGLLLTQDRQLHQVQLALPAHGSNETERYENLKHILQNLHSLKHLQNQ